MVAEEVVVQKQAPALAWWKKAVVANIVPLERRNHPPPSKPHTVRRCQAWGIVRLLLAAVKGSKKTNHQQRWWERQCGDASLPRSVKPQLMCTSVPRAALHAAAWTIITTSDHIYTLLCAAYDTS